MGKLDKRFPVYSRLLRLYPAAYQKRYRQQMLQTLGDMLSGAPTKTERSKIWTRIVLEFPISLAQQQISYIGNVLGHETPNYVKRNAIIGVLLLAPFFGAVFTHIVFRNLLGATLNWRHFYFISVIILPILACLLNLGTFLKWASDRKRSVWKSLFDLSHNWPMLATTGLALLVVAFFFHDSTHCVTGNPITEIQHWHQTWQCIQRG